MDDPIASLFYHQMKLIHANRPLAFFLENSSNLEREQGGEFVRAVKEAMTGWGYVVLHKILHADMQGIPMRRSRLFIVGLHEDGNPGTFRWPESEESLDPAKLLNPRTVADDPAVDPSTADGPIAVCRTRAYMLAHDVPLHHPD